jgi:Protein of unknown function (DUF1445)
VTLLIAGRPSFKASAQWRFPQLGIFLLSKSSAYEARAGSRSCLNSRSIRAKVLIKLFGDAVPGEPGELPVFWACGVTLQAAIAAARPPFAITHAPGRVRVTDLKSAQLAAI